MKKKNNRVNVWIMNLKDKRNIKPEGLTQSKFDFCKSCGIVGIGWANSNPYNSQEAAFLQANNAIDAFEVGDLIWVRNPNAANTVQELYLCRITSKAVATNDITMNSYDIGKYCKCDYLQILELPEALKFQRLTAIHTIEIANELCKNETLSFYNSLSINNKSKNGKKKLLISLASGVAFIILLLALISIIRMNRTTPPVLPFNLEFGMSYDEVLEQCSSETANKTVEIGEESYQPNKRQYLVPLTIAEDASVEPEFLSGEFCFLYFNEDDELYEFSCWSNTDFAELEDYYKKSLPNKSSLPSLTGSHIQLSNDLIICDLIDSIITITNPSYEPQIVKINSDTIDNAFDSINYNVGYFSINLSKLINECVDNIEVSHILYDGTVEDYTIDGEDYLEYASTSYVVTVHGDIYQNPDMKYLRTTDIDVIEILLIFDDNGNLITCKTLEECDELYTCAVLLVTQ